MRVSLKDLREAFEFVCASGGEERQAFLCKQSGKLYYHSEARRRLGQFAG
jgi:hypothetical protein